MSLHLAATRARSLANNLLNSLAPSDDLAEHLLPHSDSDRPGEKKQPKSLLEKVSSFLILGILSVVRFFFVAITPSFVHGFYHGTKPRELHKTSFLDGLRGCASFIVAIFHLEGMPPNNEWVQETWGVSEPEGMGSNLLQLPFIRVLFSGLPMVTCFFLISGFVLSYRNVQLIRSGAHEKLSESLISLIFRRGFRLFLPSIAGIMLKVVLLPCLYLRPPPIWNMIHDVYAQAGTLVYSWRWDDHEYSLLHLWTIPIEFSCSMMLFLVIFGISRLRTWMRLAVIGGLIIHANACGRWGIILFMFGLFVAEIEAMIEEQKGSREAKTWRSQLQLTFWLVAFALGLYLAGYPLRSVEASYGFQWIHAHTPKIYLDMGGIMPLKFWSSVASALVFVALFRVPALQRPFTSRIAQYLGDLSYSIYLVHHVIQISAGVVIKAHVFSWFGADNSQWKRAAILILDIVFVMGLTVWAADIFWRLVDKPIVQFTRFFDKLCRTPKNQAAPRWSTELSNRGPPPMVEQQPVTAPIRVVD